MVTGRSAATIFPGQPFATSAATNLHGFHLLYHNLEAETREVAAVRIFCRRATFVRYIERRSSSSSGAVIIVPWEEWGHEFTRAFVSDGTRDTEPRHQSDGAS